MQITNFSITREYFFQIGLVTTCCSHGNYPIFITKYLGRVNNNND